MSLGAAVAAAATAAALLPHTATVATKTPAVTAMVGALTTINNRLKAVAETAMETVTMTATRTTMKMKAKAAAAAA